LEHNEIIKTRSSTTRIFNQNQAAKLLALSKKAAEKIYFE